MKYYLIAGEASGDLHGANLIQEIKKIDPSAKFRGWGGDKMVENGAELVVHYKKMAFMGLTEVLKNLRTINKFLAQCKDDIIQYRPDKIIFIDYPGFNLKIAKFARQKNFQTHYYISPKLWAWNTKRVFKIKANIDQMLVIFPFEVEFYKQYNIDVKYVGNPLLDELSSWNNTLSKTNVSKIKNTFNRPIISLLPGSRKQEIIAHSQILSQLASIYPAYQFVLAGAPGIENSFYENLMINKDVPIIFNNTYALVKASEISIVASGTASLEVALLKTPQVVVYKTSELFYQVGKRLVKVKFISLVNLILQKSAVPEIIQKEFQLKRIKKELDMLIHSAHKRKSVENDYAKLHEILGNPGASTRAAKEIVNFGNIYV